MSCTFCGEATVLGHVIGSETKDCGGSSITLGNDHLKSLPQAFRLQCLGAVARILARKTATQARHGETRKELGSAWIIGQEKATTTPHRTGQGWGKKKLLSGSPDQVTWRQHRAEAQPQCRFATRFYHVIFQDLRRPATRVPKHFHFIFGSRHHPPPPLD